MQTSELKTYFDVVLHTFVIYVFLVLMISVFSRRQRGQLNALDMLVMLMLGSAVETAMVQASTSLKVGLVSAATLLLANFAISRLANLWPSFRQWINNAPLVLVKDGAFIESNLRHACLTEEDVMEGIRERGIGDLEDIAYAMLESDGEISVVTRIHAASSTASTTP